MIKYSRCNKIEAQCTFNRQIFKRWREEIAASTNAYLLNPGFIFKAISQKSYWRQKHAQQLYVQQHCFWKEKTFLILEWIYKTRQNYLQLLWEKRGRCATGSLVFDFALHAKHILSHLLSLLWAVFWQIEQVLHTAAMHLEQTWICLYIQFWWMEWKLAIQGTFQEFASMALGRWYVLEKKIVSASMVWKTSAIINGQPQVKWHSKSCLPDTLGRCPGTES